MKPLELLDVLKSEFAKRIVPQSGEELSNRLDPLSVGLIHQVPVLGAGARMFRIRAMGQKASSTNDIREPPPDAAPIGRLNEKGQSALYLADSPDTAFAERGAAAGDYVLSEWRVTANKLALANGAVPPAILAQRFPKQDFKKDPNFSPRQDAETVQHFFREIYLLDVGENPLLYRWSIACALVNGFAHKCDRVKTSETPEGFTHWQGRCPLSGIAYPSVRTNQKSLNYAFNDRGREHVKLDHVQWVRRAQDGSYSSLDFANEWDADNVICWQNRPAHFQLKQGESAKITKITETAWKYETADGSIPWFV
jgi:RES domain-containing protein